MVLLDSGLEWDYSVEKQFIHESSGGGVKNMSARRYINWLFRCSLWKFFSVIILVLMVYNIGRFYQTVHDGFEIDLSKEESYTYDKCVFPKLELDNKEIENLFGAEIDVKCTAEKNWIHVDNGTFIISEEARKKHGNIECSFTEILRGNDDFTWKFSGITQPFRNGSQIPSDFFNVTCLGSDGSKYRNDHQAISYQAHLHSVDSTKKLVHHSVGTNVVIIGLDSMSRLMWLRKLPRLNKLLVDEFGAIVLEGMNILGDGTPAATFPLLTGKNEEEMPETRTRIKGSVHLDNFPFIWKDYKKLGYITEFLEDYSDVAMFTYRLNGFKSQPTDHFPRPYYLVTEEPYQSEPKPFCTGSEPNAVLDLKYLSDTFRMYPNKLKFVFQFFSEFTHSRGRILFQHADIEFTKFLRKFKADGHLENTILIVTADHGCRFSELRESAQGKQEERLPYTSITFPKWFQDKYPKAYQNVKINSKRLTTMFDVHETLLDIADFRTDDKGDVSDRGISLFREIPIERTCNHAGIADHWCTCLHHESLSLTDSLVQRIAKEALNYFNGLLQPAGALCETLTLKKITSAIRLIPNRQILKFGGSSDGDGRFGTFNDATKVKQATYQISFTTGPNNGHYEVSALYHKPDKSLSFDSHFVSRTNKYNEDPRCIMVDFPDLRKYCKCKKVNPV